jgi:predicted N-acyltransferase
MNILQLSSAMHATRLALQQAWDAAHNTAAQRFALTDLVRKAREYGEALERYRCAYVVEHGQDPQHMTLWEPPRE